MSKEELLKYLIAEIDLIMHDKDYRFENANGTWYSRESCRDLTNEEVFEELRTELRQLADLETKLAESKKKNFELVAKIKLKEHTPAFCTLADGDCEALGQVEELQKQLHDLPKKIVGEIRDDMSKRIIEKQIKWGDNIQIGFICNAINECLDAILKKFGGKDE